MTVTYLVQLWREVQCRQVLALEVLKELSALQTEVAVGRWLPTEVGVGTTTRSFQQYHSQYLLSDRSLREGDQIFQQEPARTTAYSCQGCLHPSIPSPISPPSSQSLHSLLQPTKNALPSLRSKPCCRGAPKQAGTMCLYKTSTNPGILSPAPAHTQRHGTGRGWQLCTGQHTNKDVTIM